MQQKEVLIIVIILVVSFVLFNKGGLVKSDPTAVTGKSIERICSGNCAYLPDWLAGDYEGYDSMNPRGRFWRFVIYRPCAYYGAYCRCPPSPKAGYSKLESSRCEEKTYYDYKF